MNTLLIVLAAVGLAAIIVVTVAVIVLARKFGRVADDVSHLLRTAEEEMIPTAHSIRYAIGDVDRLVVQVTETAGHIDRVAAGAERLIDTAQVATAASNVIKSSAAGLLSVYEGVKQGIKTLRGS